MKYDQTLDKIIYLKYFNSINIWICSCINKLKTFELKLNNMHANYMTGNIKL